MDREQLKNRTKAFALRVIKLINSLPYSTVNKVISQQLLRSATSIGANYRSACKAKSSRDFLNKLVIVEEEADESIFWLELLMEAGIIKPEKILPLIAESKELTAIFTSSGKTFRASLKGDHPQQR